MSFDGQEGISCDQCDAWSRNDIEYPWNTLAADDGENYYFCTVNCLADWALEQAEEVAWPGSE